jgi:hypothetical protein
MLRTAKEKAKPWFKIGEIRHAISHGTGSSKRLPGEKK